MNEIQERLQQDIIRLKSKWPKAKVKVNSKSDYGPRLVTLPGFQLPEGWSPNIVTIYFSALPYSPYNGFDTKEHVDCRGNDPRYTYENEKGGTHFKWVCQEWNPNASGLFTLAMVTKQRFWSADKELEDIEFTRKVLKEASDLYCKAYAAYDKMKH
jgi:hypothetical protein